MSSVVGQMTNSIQYVPVQSYIGSVYLRWFSKLSGTINSVLGAHRTHRSQRLPQPYSLLNRSNSPSTASHIRSAMSDWSSVAGSSAASQWDQSEASQSAPQLMRVPSGHGIDRQLHPSNRKSGVKSKVTPLSLEDKANRDQASFLAISRFCGENCWPLSNAKRKKIVEECLLQANASATLENRPTTPLSKNMMNRVCCNY